MKKRRRVKESGKVKELSKEELKKVSGGAGKRTPKLSAKGKDEVTNLRRNFTLRSGDEGGQSGIPQ